MISQLRSLYERNHGWKGIIPILLLALILFGQGFIIRTSLKAAKITREAFQIYVYGQNR